MYISLFALSDISYDEKRLISDSLNVQCTSHKSKNNTMVRLWLVFYSFTYPNNDFFFVLFL